MAIKPDEAGMIGELSQLKEDNLKKQSRKYQITSWIFGAGFLLLLLLICWLLLH